MDKPIGEVLSQWKVYLTNISSNLMELSEQIEFQLIKTKAKDAVNGYTGITKVRAEQCVETLGRLWQYFAVLSEVIEKAGALYSRHSFLNNTEDDVRKLLESASMVIETERVAINERNLLSGENKEKKATPQQLLKYMQESFEGLCRNVTEITKASETVESRLRYIKADISRLNHTVKKLGITEFPVFNTDRVAEIERDPLQGAMELDKLVYSIEKYRASIKSAEEEYNKVLETFERVRGILIELKEISGKSRAAVVEAQKVFGASQNVRPVLGEEIRKSLQDWLQVLEMKLSEGNLKAVKVGVSRLEQECTSKLEIERDNYYSNSRSYNEWMDLKGQFKALMVKADIIKAKGLLSDYGLDELMIRTKAALYASIVDLDCCRQLVRKFEQSLKG